VNQPDTTAASTSRKSRGSARVNKADIFPATTSSMCKTGPTSMIRVATPASLRPARPCRVYPAELVGYCQPGEGVEVPRHGDGITSSAVPINHGVDGRRELVAPFPSSEQIDVLTRTIEDAVSLNGLTAGQGESIPTGCPKPKLRQFEEAGIHASRPRTCTATYWRDSGARRRRP
jgi:hypothetical protein